MRRLTVVVLALVCAACADHLPDQDLRILSVARPDAKLSAQDLWMGFRTDALAATRKYFGRSVDVSAVVTSFEADPKKTPHLYFSQNTEHGVRARLLDDRAADTLKDVKAGDRITLRCFCEGIDSKQDLLLKSCIRAR